MSQPTTHPSWCDQEHGPSWFVHSAEVALVPVSVSAAFDVALNQWAPSTAPVVTVTLIDGDDDTLIDLTPAAARDLAARLTTAADRLDNAATAGDAPTDPRSYR